MAFPTYKGSGSHSVGTGNVTVAMPTGGAAPAANDILLLVVQSENEAISLSDAQGFVQIPFSPKGAGTAGSNPACLIAVYWKRAVGGDAAPTVLDPGDHACGQIHNFAGCKTTGDPWGVDTAVGAGNDGAENDTTGVVPGATSDGADALVVLVCGTSFNGTSTAQFSAWTNADLANITERQDNCNTSGLGGGHGMATGEKAAAGAFGATTVTLANTSFKGAFSVALLPPTAVVVTPGTGAADLTGLAPQANLGIVSGAGALDLAGFAPQTNLGIVPGVGALDAAGFAPTAVATQNVTVTTDVGTADLTGLVPQANLGIVAALGAADLAAFAPSVVVGTVAYPGAGTLDAAGFAPTVTATYNQTATPGAGALDLTAFAPAPVVLTPYGPPVLWTAANWPSATIFFEATMRATTGRAYAQLIDSDGAAVLGSLVSTTGGTFGLVRSVALALVDGKSYRAQFGKVGSDGGAFLGARIVVV